MWRINFKLGNPEPISSLKKYQETIAILNRTIEREPSLAIAYYSRGNYKAKNMRRQEAELDLTKAILLDKDFKEAYYERGICRLESENFEGAISDFSEAIKFNYNRVDAYYFRGMSNVLIGQYKKGILD